ncbi:MAG TPA: isoaspartyl peptidase/L-asparaginase [Salinivirgaceae bacterium]|nr:isoaspartyl peptidase/L-asparaginase [Salinivirgaceae bacterium]
MKNIRPILYLLLLFIIPLISIPLLKRARNQHEDALSKTIVVPSDTAHYYAIAIHGGAGNNSLSSIPDSVKVLYQTSLYQVLEQGKMMLARGDSAQYVVVAVVSMLEDNPLFNAGKGAVLSNDGKALLDASIMTGFDKNAGAVACVENVKNPIKAAFTVMKNSPHVFLVGKGADDFARQQGLEMVNNNYFITEKSRQQWQKAQRNDPTGTVGCVVRDIYGNLAAATSTGGMANKRFGRVGDSPIIGAGTWADNNTCAVSCTGWGEYFIRNAAAFNIHSQMLYAKKSLRVAAYEVIHNQISPMGGHGALIAIDKTGEIVVEGNTPIIIFAYYNKFGQQKISLSKTFNQ